MSSDLKCFCITCRRTIADSRGTLPHKWELEMIREGKDKGKRLKFSESIQARKCKRANHDLKWEYL